MDRRTFGKTIASGLTLTVSGFSINALAGVLGCGSTASGRFCCDDFRRCIGQHYTVKGADAGTLQLDKIEPASKTNPNEQFYLMFRQAEGMNLGEGIYQLERESGESVALMLSPSISKPGILEAVVNLQTSA